MQYGFKIASLSLLFLVALAGFTPAFVYAQASVSETAEPTPTPTPEPPKPKTREERLKEHRERIKNAIAERKRLEAEGKPLPPSPLEIAEKARAEKEAAERAEREAAEREQVEAERAERLAKAKESALLPTAEARKAHATLYLSPASISVLPGDRFNTQVEVLNPDLLYVDRMQLIIKYPPQYVRPVAIHQDAIRDQLEGEPVCEYDEVTGLIRYRAQLNESVNTISFSLINIVWEALEPGEHLSIETVFESEPSLLLFGDQIMTSSLIGVEGGTSGASLRVRPGGLEERETGQRFIVDPFADLSRELARFPDQNTLRRPLLWIDQPSSGTLKKDEYVLVDVGVYNPDRVIFDLVRLSLRYDPGALEIIDTDTDNWIRTGTNVLDGPFHKLWLWDKHVRNRIDPYMGFVDYEMGTSQLREQNSGPMIRIMARVKRPIQAPPFTWIWNDGTTADTASTGLFLMGENIMLRGIPLPGQTQRAIQYEDLLALESLDYERASPTDYRFDDSPQP